jgi:hypothetical protein
MTEATALFFVADESELRRAFEGWRTPLPEREKRYVENPFTRNREPRLVWVPDPNDHVVVEPFDGYTLDERLAHLRTRASLCVDPIGLAALFVAVLERTDDSWLGRPALVAPSFFDYTSQSLWRLPDELLARVVSSTEAEHEAIAKRWTADRVGITPPDGVHALGELCRIARVARDTSRNVYYWL